MGMIMLEQYFAVQQKYVQCIGMCDAALWVSKIKWSELWILALSLNAAGLFCLSKHDCVQ